MSQQGMDPDLVRSYADQMERLAGQLDTLVGSINGSVGRMATGWFGHDAEQLAHRWQRQHRPALGVLAGHVQDLASTARAEAQQQEAASAAGGVLVRDLGSLVADWGRFVPGGTSLFDVSTFELTLGGIGVTLAQLRALKLPTRELTIDKLSKLSKVGKLAGAAGVLSVAGVGIDAYTFVNDFSTGENPWKTGYDGAHLALTGLGVAYPPVGLGLAAWDAGTFLGNRIAEIPAVSDKINDFGDGALDEGAKAVGGNTHTDPAAAARLVKRYEGVPGFFNAMSDGVKGWFN